MRSCSASVVGPQWNGGGGRLLLQFATDAPFVLALGQAADQRVASSFGEGVEEGEELALFLAGVARDLVGEDLHLGIEGVVFRSELGQLCEQPLYDLVFFSGLEDLHSLIRGDAFLEGGVEE